jgi:hypothetical protein
MGLDLPLVVGIKDIVEREIIAGEICFEAFPNSHHLRIIGHCSQKQNLRITH